jgi:pilus assembly protein FimV
VDLLGEDEPEYDGVTGTDEISTKLDLAKAYIDMGDQESALSILDEVAEDGSEDQQREASALRRQIG